MRLSTHNQVWQEDLRDKQRRKPVEPHIKNVYTRETESNNKNPFKDCALGMKEFLKVLAIFFASSYFLKKSIFEVFFWNSVNIQALNPFLPKKPQELEPDRVKTQKLSRTKKCKWSSLFNCNFLIQIVIFDPIFFHYVELKYS